MTKLAMLISVCAVAFGVQVYRVAADDVPTYDVRKSCKTDTQGYQGPGTAARDQTLHRHVWRMNKPPGLRSSLTGPSLRPIPDQGACKWWATLLASKAMSSS